MEYLILASIGFVAALTPGPDIFYVIRQGLCHGLKSSLTAVAGILTGNIVYLTLVAVGLSSIGKNIYFQIIVGISGSIYLFRISIIIFKEKVHLNLVCKNSKDIYKEALLLNLSNPKAMIFFAVIITPFMSKNIMLSCGSLFLGIIAAFVFGAVISSKIKIKDKWLNIINKIAAVLFFFFGVKLFLFALKDFEIILSILN
ncbi:MULTISPECIES: LysE family translocator [unclassified Lebetimonas]|uniref:LysE family translocator n=1 Tax=unclassified Lebetimonas TaxID=2648158 RepID=UPI000466D5FE|nr:MULTISPECIES: LysE family translocator [unclassified Lebetimonas]